MDLTAIYLGLIFVINFSPNQDVWENKKILSNQHVNNPDLHSWPVCVMSIGLILTNLLCEKNVGRFETFP
jgi:hypothetical protein